MKLLLLTLAALTLTACTVLPVTHESGTHYALVDSLTGNKCVDVKVDEGSIEVTGVVKWFSSLLIQGKGAEYHSHGKMCETHAPTP